MRFTVDIDCDNAAFTDWPEQEVANILRQARVKLSTRGRKPTEDDPIRLLDTNGNMVGFAKFEEVSDG